MYVQNGQIVSGRDGATRVEGPEVLVVGGDEQTAQHVSAMLAEQGYAVVRAATLLQGWAQMDGGPPPEVFVLDAPAVDRVDAGVPHASPQQQAHGSSGPALWLGHVPAVTRILERERERAATHLATRSYERIMDRTS